MTARRVPTYAEIASFRESLLKSKKTLAQEELAAQQTRLMRMDYNCLRAIASLSHRSDLDLLARARQRAHLEHYQYAPRSQVMPEWELEQSA